MISLIKRRRNNHNLLYLRSVDEDRQAPPSSARPGYQEAKTALVEMQRQSRKDLRIPFVPKSEAEHFKENANFQPHLPLLSGLQHPGGAHARGLRIGKDGINAAGRMTRGQSNGDPEH